MRSCEDVNSSTGSLQLSADRKQADALPVVVRVKHLMVAFRAFDGMAPAFSIHLHDIYMHTKKIQLLCWSDLVWTFKSTCKHISPTEIVQNQISQGRTDTPR